MQILLLWHIWLIQKMLLWKKGHWHTLHRMDEPREVMARWAAKEEGKRTVVHNVVIFNEDNDNIPLLLLLNST